MTGSWPASVRARAICWASRTSSSTTRISIRSGVDAPPVATSPDVPVLSRAAYKENRGAAHGWCIAKKLSRSYRTRGLTTETAAHGDALWIGGPVELTAVSSTAVVRKRADQLISRGDKHP